ncbi:DNA topoisomerase IB [Chryseosolibacter indicus]|uniref:DNA topoisomerase n=1 Tax=Chryseosolibacter indicus TaxID=2782351 RepID=A0ABS5VV33_9BACT|nr:DNA topoisomerase IB [Chryseosolibacter indicus]MBT1705298.1 DNA topoisomerase IB [Chryseosolibacter indicus]
MRAVPHLLTHRDFIKIDKNYEAAASVVNLTYVSDKEAGITRVKKGNGFSYTYKGNTVRDPKTLERIKKLVIPPAWTKVWICPTSEGHIQATGYDARNRKQYRYHNRWSALQQETKFHRLIEFGKVLPELRKRLQKDLDQPGFPVSKIMAIVLSLMERTFIRIGNEGYEKQYGSYGLTTLKDNHVDIKGSEVTFSFKGKKGVYHKVKLKSKKFAKLVRQCKAIPGKELFQYYDENGEHRKIDSGQVNQYLKECLQMDFTTKDFRTWAGTLSMLQALRAAAKCEKKSDYKKNIVAAMQEVSQKLGNTVAVCKKYYVHPEIVNLYNSDTLHQYFETGHIDSKEKQYGLSSDEEILMKILSVVQKSKVEITC